MLNMLNDKIQTDEDHPIDLTASGSRLPRIKSNLNKERSPSKERYNSSNNESFFDKDALGGYVKTEVDNGSSPKM